MVEKVTDEQEKETLLLDFEKLTVTTPVVPKLPKKLTLSMLANTCLDLSNLIIDEAKNLQGLSKDLAGIKDEPFRVEDYVSFSLHRDEDVAGSFDCSFKNQMLIKINS